VRSPAPTRQRRLSRNEQAGPPAEEDRAAVAVRLAGIAFGGGIAVAASVVRRTRERRLTTLVQMDGGGPACHPGPGPGGHRRPAVHRHNHSAAEQAAVGGDLYEVLDSPWGVRLLVGDVRGKGLDAVRLANRVLGCFRALAGRLEAPHSWSRHSTARSPRSTAGRARTSSPRSSPRSTGPGGCSCWAPGIPTRCGSTGDT
jgi:hypothetical protein